MMFLFILASFNLILVGPAKLFPFQLLLSFDEMLLLMSNEVLFRLKIDSTLLAFKHVGQYLFSHYYEGVYRGVLVI